MLSALCSGYRGSIILGHGHITLSAYREGLTYHVLSAEQGKSVSPPCGEVKPQGGSMVMRIAELRKSEGCPVTGQIEVALPFWDNITSPETEQTSRWCSNSRTFAEPMNEAMQMTTAQAVGAASHTSYGLYPLPCELAASPYRVGLICT
jgi:hypothetical protein